MKKLTRYLENNQIKPNLTKEKLLELKELLDKTQAKDKNLGTRTKECYLWEIEKRLKSNE